LITSTKLYHELIGIAKTSKRSVPGESKKLSNIHAISLFMQL